MAQGERSEQRELFVESPGGIGRVAYTGRYDLTVLPVDDEVERGEAMAVGVEAWPGGERDHFVKINPMRVTGRRIRQVAGR